MRRLSVASLAMALLAYGASPYVALAHLARSVQSGDVRGLEAALDWNTVRQSLKDEVRNGSGPAIRTVSQLRPADDLPAFGDSFATNVISNAVDDEVTPARLGKLMSRLSSAAGEGGGRPLVLAARFISPACFEVAVAVPGGRHAAPVRLSLRIEHWRWAVTRMWLPDTILDGAPATAHT